jgi:hypothetical protein
MELFQLLSAGSGVNGSIFDGNFSREVIFIEWSSKKMEAEQEIGKNHNTTDMGSSEIPCCCYTALTLITLRRQGKKISAV